MQSYLTAEISASAVRTNLALLRRHVAPSVKLCAVVKADCYGHGVETLLDVISSDADCLGVARPEEAIEIRSLGCRRPILVMSGICGLDEPGKSDEAMGELISGGIMLTACSVWEVDRIAAAAAKIGACAQVHVKIDTGMGRAGAPAASAAAVAEKIRGSRLVELSGLYTHFATADEEDKGFALEQLRRFKEAVAACGCEGLTLHAANSAAAIDLVESHLDMVRPGISIYGYQPSDSMHTRLPLRPSLRLTSRLIQVKDIPAGSGCGYGLTYTFERPSRVGLVPIGYADGYLRCLSNKATMRVRGRDVPVRGRVSMDQVIVELTDAPGAQVGDEVEIISPTPADPHSVENLARLAGTIPYEITCRLGNRIKRALVN